MSKVYRPLLVCLLAVGCLFALNATAQDPELPAPLDAEALNQLSLEERQAVTKAYKDAVDAYHAAQGNVQGERGAYTPIDNGGQAGIQGVTKVPGTFIQYDTGVITGTITAASNAIGNRFDTALNPTGMCCVPVETSGTITMATFNMQSVAGTGVFFTVFSNISGTMANVVASPLQTGIAPGLNTIAVGATTGVYANGSFLATVWQSSGGTDNIGLDTNENSGQGFHGIFLNDIVGTALADIVPPANAIMRVRGDVTTPVELMSFSLE